MNSQLSPVLQDRANGTPSSTPSNLSEVDLYELWRTLVDFKWTIILIAMTCFGGATVLSFIMTKTYLAEVLVVPAEESKSGGGLAALAGQFGGLAEIAGVNLGAGAGNKDTAIAYLKSRIFLEDYIKEKNLLPILYADKWDAASQKWKVKDQQKAPSLWDAYQLFSKKIVSVNADKKTGLINVYVEWKDREQAVEWANDLIKRANSNLRQKAISETELSLSYLEKELQKTSVVEVQQAIFKLMENQIKTKMMANVQEQFAFKVIDPAGLMDEDAFVKPKRSVLMALGLLGGIILGILVALTRKFIVSHRKNAS